MGVINDSYCSEDDNGQGDDDSLEGDYLDDDAEDDRISDIDRDEKEEESNAAGDASSYDRTPVMESVWSELLIAGATKEQVEACKGALPQSAPAPLPVNPALLAAYTAFWALAATLALGCHSIVFAMVGLFPLDFPGVMQITYGVYAMHFPVDKYHMMGAGSEVVWKLKNLLSRFIGSDNQAVSTVCCTGYFLLTLLEHLPLGNVPIIDLHPFCNTARGGGYSEKNVNHRTGLKRTLNIWLDNGRLCSVVPCRIHDGRERSACKTRRAKGERQQTL